jgi:hypothetical protein
MKTVEEVIRAVFTGILKGSYLIPVADEYKGILGATVWVCSDSVSAEKKRQTEACIVLTANEVKTFAEAALLGRDTLQRLIATKLAFNGEVLST